MPIGHETLRKNMNIAAKERIDHYDSKQHKMCWMRDNDWWKETG
jgi:hypothetical protein